LYQALANATAYVPPYRLALARAYRAHGGVLQRAGRKPDAEAAYKQALAIQEQLVGAFPDDLEVRSELAATLLANGKSARDSAQGEGTAKPQFQRALALLGREDKAAHVRPGHRQRLAQVHIEFGKLLTAEVALKNRQQTRVRGPEAPLDQFTDAERHLRLGIDLLNGLLATTGAGPDAPQIREDLAEGLTVLSSCLGNAKRPQEATDVDRRAVELREKQAEAFPAVPEYRHRLAQSLRERGNHLYDLDQFREAEPHYNRGIALMEALTTEFPEEAAYRGTLVGLLTRLAWCTTCTDRFDETDRILLRSVSIHKGLGLPPGFQGGSNQAMVSLEYLTMALMFAYANRDERAEMAFRRAAEACPDNADDCLIVGCQMVNVSVDARRIKPNRNWQAEAVRVLERSVRLNPNDPSAHYNLGLSLENMGNLAGAIAAHQESIRLKPSVPDFHFHLGTSLEKAGRVDEAIASYKEAIRREPRFFAAHLELAAHLVNTPDPQLRDPHQAVWHAEKAVTLVPNYGIAWMRLGSARYRTGAWSGAVEALTKGNGLSPADCDSEEYFLLAMAHWQLGQHGRARVWYDQGVAWMVNQKPKHEIVDRPLSPDAIVAQVDDPGAGGIVVFSGVVRNETGGRPVKYLEYEAHAPMAEAKLREIARLVRGRWPSVCRLALVHRLGRLEIGESSVMIAVTAPHRGEAFEACRFAIDTLKDTVPIWKKEHFEDGAVWVGLQSQCDHRH
jgi:molybdopterin synthase catalytic subunit